MRLYLPIYLTVLAFTWSLSVYSQVDSTVHSSTSNVYGATRPAGFTLKPRLGLGVGSLVFYGDIGRDNRGYHPGSADMAYMLSLTNDVTSYLDVSLYTLFGTITINETTNPRALNMQSQIRSGGIMATYNFDHFLPSDRGAEPFIGFGFEAFEFLSKTDLYDANGTRYHYWSDGTIRSIAQGAPGAEDAVFLERDYVYETDLREMNLDGRGAYPERSFAIPVTAGIQFRVTDRFRARLATRYLFTFTDLVDNMTPESQGERQGSSRNDRFMYTHLTVNYDLNPLRTKPKRFDDPFFGLDDEELLAALEDTDGDGVADLLDKCPGTPPGVEVDARGCPIDSDGDGIPDYLDLEPFSEHTYVDPFGVAMDDDAVYQRYLMWHDSIPWVGSRILNEDHARIESDFSRAKDIFRVRITRDTDGLSQENINALLAQSDVATVTGGDEAYFLVGEFDAIPDAVRRKAELSRSGISGAVVTGKQGRDTYSEIGIDPLLEAQIEEELDLHEDDSRQVHYRVQVGAFRGALSADIFADIGTIISIRGDDGLTRYVSSSFERSADAARLKTDLLVRGFTDAFITAYRGGVRITLAEAGMNVRLASRDRIDDQETQLVDAELVKFSVVLGEYGGDIPTDQVDLMLSLGGVRPRRQPNGETIFMTSPTDSVDDANDLRDRAAEMGIRKPEVRGLFNGKVIPLDDALRLKKVGPRQVAVAG